MPPVLVYVSMAAMMLTQVKCLPTLNMTVYYQSTSHSSTFIRHQLYPTYLYLNQHNVTRIQMELVPYQDSSCDNNPATYNKWMCLYVKLYACATTVLQSDWQRLNFVHCITSGEKVAYLQSQKCALQTCVDDLQLSFCVNSVDGDEILADNALRVKNLKVELGVFPIVTFGGVYVEEEQEMARDNLLALLCRKYQTALEGFCNSPRAKRNMAHHNYDTYFFYDSRRRCNLK